MKNLAYLLCISLLSYGISGFSQDKPLMIGVELGPSMGYLQGEIDERLIGEKTVGLGFHGGIIGHFFQSESFSLNLGLVFTQKPIRSIWTEIDANGNEIKTPSSIPYNFLQLPISSRFYLGKEAKYYLDLGGFISFVLSSPGRRVLGGNSIDLGEQLDWGLSLEFGRRFQMNKNQYLFTGLASDLGLRDANKFNSLRLSENPLYSRGLFFKLAYLWPQRN